jgi:hypothetical protein
MKKPNMFGGGQKPGFALNRPAVTRPQIGVGKGQEGGADLRSSIVEAEGSFRPDSKLSEALNKPFIKFGGTSQVSRPESRIKPEPEETAAPVLETAMKMKVNFTGEIKTKPKRKEDNFFDDPMPDQKLQKQAKPNFSKATGQGDSQIAERKAKERNFFDEENNDFQVSVKDTIAKPNLGKPRLGASISAAPGELRTVVNTREELPENPYEEFEVLSHEQG